MRAFIASRIREFLGTCFSGEGESAGLQTQRGHKSGVYTLQHERVTQAQLEYLKRIEQPKRPISV